jgi:signal transduction histidine kinase
MKFRLAPPSLTLRIFLVLLLGVSAAAALTYGLAQRDRRDVIAHFHGREASQRFADTLRLLAALPREQRRAAVSGFNPGEWRLAPPEACDGLPAPHLGQGLSERIAGIVAIDTTVRFPRARAGDEPPGPPGPPLLGVRGRFADGEAFCLLHQGQRRMPPQIEQWRFPGSLALFVALIALVAWFAVRLALRPLRRMTAAAEAFGHDIQHPPLDTHGPGEVKQAAVAFNRMQERVREMMAERTQILAAVTHDLKTPLTRMRLRLEGCGDEALREKLGNDVAAMQRLVDEGLELARSMQSVEPAVRVDLDALLSALADDAADAGQPVRYAGTPGILATCKPGALHRAVNNLVDNALKYGGEAELSLERQGGEAVIRVRDRGPGIPAERLEEVLRPFVRLESSRCRESGGTGLGLAIAGNLVAAQGGRLTLENRQDGGLEARIVLPAA